MSKPLNEWKLEAGDTIWCVSPIEGYLTYGRHYMVIGLRADEGRIIIKDDLGNEMWCKIERFYRL